MRNVNSEGDGWDNWSRHILKELERLNENLESMKAEFQATRQELHSEISDLRESLAKVEGIGYSVDDIKNWRAKYEDAAVLNKVKELDAWKISIGEVVTPNQLENMKEDIQKLKSHRDKTNMIWTVIVAAGGVIGLFFTILKFVFSGK